MADIDTEIHQARIEYLDAAIAEINAVCNSVENEDEAKTDVIRQEAQTRGEVAQEKFERFVQLVESRKASKANEN